MLYEIKLRIYDYNFVEQKKDLRYLGKGVVKIENNIIEGYIARDYISGTIKNDVIDITVFDVDFNQGYNLTSQNNKKVEFPGKYTLYCGGFMEAEISFDHKLSKEKSKDAIKELEEIKHLANL